MAKRMELLPFKKATLNLTQETLDNHVVYNADAAALKPVARPRIYVFTTEDFDAFLKDKDTANVVVQVTKVALSKEHFLGGPAPAAQTASWNEVKIHKLQ